MILSAVLPIDRARRASVFFRPALDCFDDGLTCPDLGGEIVFQRARRAKFGDNWSVFSATTRATSVARWPAPVSADPRTASLFCTRQAEITLVVVRIKPALNCRWAHSQTLPYPLVPKHAR